MHGYRQKEQENKMKKYLLLSLLSIVLLQASSGVMASGQKTCYNATEEIPCPEEGEPFYGQDASYRSGKPIHLIKDSDLKIIKDVTNNLTWQLNSRKYPSTVQSGIQYCETLQLAGITDWRLPTMSEMMTWFDFSVPLIPIHPYFIEDNEDEEHIHWWSSSVSNDPNKYWSFNKGEDYFSGGAAIYLDQDLGYYVRCVSGPQLSEEEDVVVYDDVDVVYDKRHGLMWQDSSDVFIKRTWEEALAYCEESEFEGFSDWKLPSVSELHTLGNFTDEEPIAQKFTNKGDPLLWLWSSTTAANRLYAIIMHFTDNDNIYTSHSHKTYIQQASQVRCVREIPIVDHREEFDEEVINDVSDYNSSSSKILSLTAGWNLVALPVDINISGSDYVHYFNGYELIYTFSQEGGWVKDPPMIHAGEGFWIMMPEAHSYTFSGESYSIVEKIAALPDGWHLLGTGQSSVLASFSDIGDDVWSYKEEVWDNNPGSVKENSGFWIHKQAGSVQVVKISSTSTPIPELNAVDDALMLTEGDCSEVDEVSFVCSGQDFADIQRYQQKALFIDDLFRGVIDAVEEDGATVRITVREADTIKDVYKDFNITLNADEVLSGLNQAAPQLHGRYDGINSVPLRHSFRRADTAEDDEIILRIDFPKGYFIPIRKSAFNCELLAEGSCEGSISVSQSNHTDLGATKERYGLTVSTEGSYVEVGIGAYISAKYDHNFIGADNYRFELQNSAYFKSNVKFTISGKLEREWKTNIKISNMINVEIVHPYSAAVKLEVGFQPMVEIGAQGTLEAELVAQSSTIRTGKIGFKYDSRAGQLRTNSSVVYSAFNENSVEYEAKVEAHAFLIPRVALRPKLKFLRVSQALSFGEIRGGVKIDAGLAGEVKTDFTITNEGFNTNIQGAEAGLNLGVSALVDYILEIRLGKEVLYAMNEYETLYESSQYLIFDWKLSLLPDPQLALVNRTAILSEFDVSTDLEENAKKVKYYYAVAAEGAPDYNGSLLGFRSNAHPLDGNRLSIQGTRKLYIQGELHNSDVSSSIWSFGTSLSKILSMDLNASTLDDMEAADNNGTGGGDVVPEIPGGPNPDYDGCDLWAIRFANHESFDCSFFTDPSDIRDCELYNACFDRIVCESWEQAQSELDSCTVNYVHQ